MAICGNELDSFRRRAGDEVLSLVQSQGNLFIGWPTGVGKSCNIDEIIEKSLRDGIYDLIIVFAPTREIIKERRFVDSPPQDIRVVNLKPRPEERCGDILNTQWRKYEKRGMGAYARANICTDCPGRKACQWPEQYGRRMKGAQVVFATQAHLVRAPDFSYQLVNWSGQNADSVLVIIDEADVVVKPRRRKLKKEDLSNFLHVLEQVAGSRFKKIIERWCYLVGILINARSSDLRCNEWRFPQLPSKLTLAIQSKLYQRFAEDAKYIGYDLMNFGRSDVASREVIPSGDIEYAAISNIPGDVIIYSATLSPELARYRLGEDYYDAFAGYKFQHPDTKWYNIASLDGAKKYYPGNSPQILNFFTELTKKRLEEGKRVLLVAKKFFVKYIAAEFERRLRELGMESVRVITSNFSNENLSQPFTIPLINYGVSGVNNFQEFDCAYCVTSYYVDEGAVSATLQDTLGSESQIPLKISIKGRPLRRLVHSKFAPDRYYDVSQVAQHALQYLEMGAVVQAVGRVRPFTKPREVITFQCGEPTDFGYTKEFTGLAQAREFFGLRTQRVLQRLSSITKVLEAKREGLNQTDAAVQTELGLRTVQRYWNKPEPATNPISNIQ